MCKQVPGYETGNFIGPTILSDVTPDMECYKVYFSSTLRSALTRILCFLKADCVLSYGLTFLFLYEQEEIFGPVLLCMQVKLAISISFLLILDTLVVIA